jgi:uncharacterized glyoxalase superfamily protein PhnB
MKTEFLEIVPVLSCEDIAGEHDFLVKIVGLDSGGLARAPDGSMIHGEVRAGDRRIWLHRTSETAKLSTPEKLGAASGGMVVFVGDVDAHFAHAKGAGAIILSAPADQPYGQREYGLRDPEGHSWWIATPISSAG